MRRPHELLERAKLETRLAVGDLQEQSIQLWTCLEGLHEQLEVREVEVSPVLRVCLLHRDALLRTDRKETRSSAGSTWTHLEPPHQVLARGVNIEPPAQPLDIVKVEPLVLLLVRALPELLLPQRLAHVRAPEPAHQLLPDRVQAAQRRVPHLEDLARRRDEVQRLVPAVEDVHDREPFVLVLLRELELRPVISRVRAAPQLLDVLDRDCVRGRGTSAIGLARVVGRGGGEEEVDRDAARGWVGEKAKNRTH